MINPFDLKTALLAKHAQHVVLVHFPIAYSLQRWGSTLSRNGRNNAAWRCGVLQLARGGDFNSPGSRHWATRVAVSTRGEEAEGNPFAAFGSRVCLKRDDMAGVVGTFPRSKRTVYLPSYRLRSNFWQSALSR